jgi:hypothetical protein
MSVKPKLICPPDYSILSLRFTECKKIGIVKGITTLFAFDLSNFFIPVTNFSERRFTVKAGQKKKLDIGDLGVNWPLKESYTFVYTDPGVSDLTEHTFTMYSEDGTQLEQISFTVDATVDGYATFAEAFASALAANTALALLLSATYGPADSQVTVVAKTEAMRYKYLLEYDTEAWVSGPYLHPGTLVTKDYKYPEGRVRAIFLYADYSKADTKTCGCTDPSGELLSNVKNFKWAWDSDYAKKQPTAKLTGVLVDSDASILAQQNLDGSQTFKWLATGNAAAYHIEVGDLVTLNTLTNNPYGYITNIDGYFITVDRQGFGTGLETDQLVKSYAPAGIEWRTAGEMLFISGGQDVYDEDRLYTETIWIHNTQNYDVPFTAIIVS